MRRDHSTVQTASDILNRQLLLLLPHIRDIDELKSLVAIKEAVQHCLSLVSSESRIVIYKLAINPLNPQLNSVNYSDLTKLCGKIKIDSSLLISISDSTYIMASILNGNNVKEHTELLYRELSYLMAKNPCKVQISFTQTTLRDLTSSEHFLKSLENSLKVFMDILNDNSLMGWLGAIYQQEVYDHQFVLPCSVSIESNIAEGKLTCYYQFDDDAKLPPILRRSYKKSIARVEAISSLTEKEISVLERLSLGKTNEQIANELNYSLDTIKGYNKRIFAKLNVKNRTEAILAFAKLSDS